MLQSFVETVRAIVPLCVMLTCLVLLTLFHAAVNDAKDRPLTIAIRPLIAFAPADLSIFIRLIPDPRDRQLRVWTDGLNYSRSSEWSIEGAQSPKSFTVEWRRVFGGEYDVIASVSDSLHVIRASAAQRVILSNP